MDGSNTGKDNYVVAIKWLTKNEYNFFLNVSISGPPSSLQAYLEHTTQVSCLLLSYGGQCPIVPVPSQSGTTK